MLRSYGLEGEASDGWAQRGRGKTTLLVHLLREPHTAFIANAGNRSRSHGHAALRFTFDRARARAITEVRGAASAPMYRAAYERNGLAPVAQTTPMIGCRPGTSAASAIEGARHWFLSKGDHDWDQYPLG